LGGNDPNPTPSKGWGVGGGAVDTKDALQFIAGCHGWGCGMGDFARRGNIKGFIPIQILKLTC